MSRIFATAHVVFCVISSTRTHTHRHSWRAKESSAQHISPFLLRYYIRLVFSTGGGDGGGGKDWLPCAHSTTPTPSAKDMWNSCDILVWKIVEKLKTFCLCHLNIATQVGEGGEMPSNIICLCHSYSHSISQIIPHRFASFPSFEIYYYTCRLWWQCEFFDSLPGNWMDFL